MIEKALRIVITVLAGVGGLLTADRVLLMLPQGVLPDFARIGFFGVTVGTIVFYLVINQQLLIFSMYCLL